MSIAGGGQSGKIGSLVEMAQDLAVMAERAAIQGAALHDLERNVFDKLLKMGHAVIGEFLALQGDGNLGETVTTDAGQTLHRSRESVARPLRTTPFASLQPSTIQPNEKRTIYLLQNRTVLFNADTQAG